MAGKSKSRSGPRPAKGKSRKNTAAQKQASGQFHAIILFFIGIVWFVFLLVKGSSGKGWGAIHRALFGLFGSGAVLVGILLIYIAVLMALEKPWKGRAWLCSALLLAFCGSLQVFIKPGYMPDFETENILDIIVHTFVYGAEGNGGGGIFGGILGLPFLALFGKVGGGILIILLILFLLTVLSGSTLISLVQAARKPLRAMGAAYTQQMERRRQAEQEKRKAAPPVKTAASGKAPAKQPAHKGDEKNAQQPAQAVQHKNAPKMQIIDIPLDGDPSPKPEPQQPVHEAEAAEENKMPNQPEPKKEIDIPLDDDFTSSETGGFALGMGDVPEPQEQEPATDPSLDELVKKAASPEHTVYGVQHEPLQEKPVHEPMQAQEKLAFHLNLPPDIDAVEGFGGPPKNDPFFAKPHSSRPLVPEPPGAQDHSVPVKPQEPVRPEPFMEQPVPQASVLSEPPKPPAPRPYRKPPFSLLRQGKSQNTANEGELKANAQLLVDTLASFGVQTRIVDISRGPAVTRYELQPSAGVKISKITGLADDIALNLAAAGVRIEAPIPNKAAVGIEVPNKSVSVVTLREIVDSEPFLSAKSKLTVALGRDIAGNIALADIAKMPHLLIAGSTGSGKSVCINSIIMSLLFQAVPEEVRFLMIDPKVVELGVYNGIPHLLVPVVTDPKKAAGALSWAVTEMLKRYKLFADNGVRDLKGFNHLAERTEGLEKMSQVVIIIDELADLMMAAPNEIEDYICRLAQMARAAGMHLIIATQRPSVDVITGVIKANIPSRIAFAVSSQVDSRTILDMGGAEKLLGRGDMLFNPIGSAKPVRVQGCFVTDEEIESVISFIKSDATADYDPQIVKEIDSHVPASGKKGSSAASDSGGGGESEDEMLMAAIEFVVEAGAASTSLLQRRLRLGYGRAARIIDEMEARGIVGPSEGSKPRKVLLTPERLAEWKLAKQE